ncbi:MAG: ATP synthase subunit a [Holosporales bacterium]
MDLLHQFEIHKIMELSLFGMDISFTNASLFMLIAVGAFCLFSYLAVTNFDVIPNKRQSVIEMLYQFMLSTVETFAGKEGLRYFPYFFALFVFILSTNLIGLIPGCFTVTSQIVVTGTLALIVFISVTVIGILKHGFHFLRLFLPHGIPWYIAILLVPVEIISYFSRPLSLSIRLFANMVAGHILLKVFASFAALTVGTFLLPASIVPIIVNTTFTFFELVVAFLQAYIFTILSCIYLKDALNLH